MADDISTDLSEFKGAGPPVRIDASGKWRDAKGRFTNIKGHSGKIIETNYSVNEVTATRVRIGSKNGKMAVIGRNMDDRVKVFAEGIGAEIFKPSKRASDLAKAVLGNFDRGPFYGMEAMEIFND